MDQVDDWNCFTKIFNIHLDFSFYVNGIRVGSNHSLSYIYHIFNIYVQIQKSFVILLKYFHWLNFQQSRIFLEDKRMFSKLSLGDSKICNYLTILLAIVGLCCFWAFIFALVQLFLGFLRLVIDILSIPLFLLILLYRLYSVVYDYRNLS
jgi:hypothetical protein